MAPDARPHISIIIVTHNSLTSLRGCLATLARAEAIDTCELILVDNASSDCTPDDLARLWSGARVVSLPENTGFASACNTGADLARGDYLLFLNPDVQVDSDALTKLVAAADATGDGGLISARLRNPDGTFHATSRNFPTLGNLLFSRGSILSQFLGSRIDKRGKYTLPDIREITEVP
ncbi:MAG: glycosyltransferase, partial [candidate division Zixibacteria bacterium]|nr:glycosyltransferase [candidate division Zixibacteria bacterium]